MSSERASPYGNTHVAFLDETHHNTGRYRGLSVVSARRSEALRICKDLRDVLARSGIEELKWRRLASAKARFAACELVAYVVDQAANGALRIDTLIWDTHDGRHRVPGRDDVSNLGRMHFHLLRTVLQQRWPDARGWAVCPDENSLVDWGALRAFLETTVKRRAARGLPFPPGSIPALVEECRIVRVAEVRSEKWPLVQVADLFAGLGIYSRANYERYPAWRVAAAGQLGLFDDAEAGGVALTGSDRERCPVLHELVERCRVRRLGVGLEGSRGLETRNPRNPINFWVYRPQRVSDKAPTTAGYGSQRRQGSRSVPAG